MKNSTFFFFFLNNADFFKQKSGLKGDSGVDHSLVREKKMVDKFLVKSGMLRFSFLLECCRPGSLPDPQLVAAMLDLVSIFSDGSVHL